MEEELLRNPINYGEITFSPIKSELNQKLIDFKARDTPKKNKSSMQFNY